MECNKSVLDALRREYEAVGISLKGVSDKELQKQIKANIGQFQDVEGMGVVNNIEELAAAYERSRNRK